NQTGEIRLIVTDPSGAPVEVSGRLDHVASGNSKRFRTSSQGRATLGGLPFGKYHLEIGKSGFAREIVDLDVTSTSPLN
ncbi:carboxypeptidase-like regulatory domain-containing protein, partial [Klebsiella pneumoniae]|uniref:carboxypeptidase-like regulatory domain-containing protein n=1 Tax=Klebsiella pneumoniae TaxID=573 RepID=UPI002ADFE1C5